MPVRSTMLNENLDCGQLYHGLKCLVQNVLSATTSGSLMMYSPVIMNVATSLHCMYLHVM